MYIQQRSHEFNMIQRFANGQNEISNRTHWVVQNKNEIDAQKSSFFFFTPSLALSYLSVCDEMMFD